MVRGPLRPHALLSTLSSTTVLDQDVRAGLGIGIGIGIGVPVYPDDDPNEHHGRTTSSSEGDPQTDDYDGDDDEAEAAAALLAPEAADLAQGEGHDEGQNEVPATWHVESAEDIHSLPSLPTLFPSRVPSLRSLPSLGASATSLLAAEARPSPSLTSSLTANGGKSEERAAIDLLPIVVVMKIIRLSVIVSVVVLVAPHVNLGTLGNPGTAWTGEWAVLTGLPVWKFGILAVLLFLALQSFSHNAPVAPPSDMSRKQRASNFSKTVGPSALMMLITQPFLIHTDASQLLRLYREGGGGAVAGEALAHAAGLAVNLFGVLVLR